MLQTHTYTHTCVCIYIYTCIYRVHSACYTEEGPKSRHQAPKQQGIQLVSDIYYVHRLFADWMRSNGEEQRRYLVRKGKNCVN